VVPLCFCGLTRFLLTLTCKSYSVSTLQCLPSLEANRYLLEEEEVYEPPEDPDSGIYRDPSHLSSDSDFAALVLFWSINGTDCRLGLSLEELGMRALERLPRDRAIDGIHAFNGMRSVAIFNILELRLIHLSVLGMIWSSISGPSHKKARWSTRPMSGSSSRP
jgi:hypothetical protein